MTDSSESRSTASDSYSFASLSYDSSFACLMQKGIEKMTDFQKFALDLYARQTSSVISSWKRFVSPPALPEIFFIDAASQSMEYFVNLQKKLLDLIANQSMATLGQTTTQPPPAQENVASIPVAKKKPVEITMVETMAAETEQALKKEVEATKEEFNDPPLLESEESILAKKIVDRIAELQESAPAPVIRQAPIKTLPVVPELPKGLPKAVSKPKPIVSNPPHNKRHQSGKHRNGK